MLFLQYGFTYTTWEIAITTSHLRNILKIKKPVPKRSLFLKEQMAEKVMLNPTYSIMLVVA
jgi:hypothetical protein